jgi:hypothetical protein
MKKSIVLVTVLLATLTACTDAMQGKISAFGGSANVTCYSGDKLIYQGESTGKVSNSESSDGYYFIDKADNKLKEVSGNCVITYNTY